MLLALLLLGSVFTNSLVHWYHFRPLVLTGNVLEIPDEPPERAHVTSGVLGTASRMGICLSPHLMACRSESQPCRLCWGVRALAVVHRQLSRGVAATDDCP